MIFVLSTCVVWPSLPSKIVLLAVQSFVCSLDGHISGDPFLLVMLYVVVSVSCLL